jgi:Mor family transcriptional regulator
MGRKKRTDPSGRDLKIIEIRDNGRHTLEELGKMFNLSKQRVLQICDRYNCRKFSNRVISEDAYKQIISLYKKREHTQAELADKFKISQSHVSRIILKEA